ncbi:BafA family autotransporter [Bartonella sp. B35(2025)]
MQRKLRLSFWTLMTSSFLVNVANADGAAFPGESPLIFLEVSKQLGEMEKSLPKIKGLKEKSKDSKRIPNKQVIAPEEPLKEEKGVESFSFEVLTNSIIGSDSTIYIVNHNHKNSGKKENSFNYKNGGYSINNTVQDGGKLYINEASISRDTIIESDGTEFVQNLSTSEYAIVKKGGKQIIENGASADKVKIYSGEQFIFGESDINGEIVSSSAYDTVIYGQDKIPGVQNIHIGGVAFNTKVMRGGIQNIDGTKDGNSALALGTEVFKNGMQIIFAGGKARDVVLYDHAIQEVHKTGYVNDLTIHDQAQSWLYAGAILDGVTNINDFGSLYIYAGDGEPVTEVKDLILNGENARLYYIATKTHSKKSPINIKNLSGSGRVIFTFTGSDRNYSQLDINNLSGNLHFDFNTNFAEQHGDYLLIKKKGTGYHTISVTDSGIEITNSTHKKLKLISDRSGGAHFTLTNTFGEKISAVDAGTYMYSLKYRKNKDRGKIWYLDKNYTIDNRETLTISDFIPNTPVDNVSTDLSTDVLTDLIIYKDRAIYIFDPSFNFHSEVGDNNSNSDGDVSISNTVQNGGRIYVYNGGLNLHTKIKSGGIEIIKAQGISQDTVIYEDGQQSIEDGGKAEGTQIYGGKQFVFGKSKSKLVRSNADGTVVSGQDQASGYQNVYNGGVVYNTKIIEGGVQNLYVKDYNLDEEDYGGTAFDTQIFSGGKQNVLVGGKAFNVMLSGTAIQKINLGGYVKDLMINDRAESWLHHGAILEGRTTVNNSGRIYLYAGKDVHTTTAEDIYLNGKDTRLYFISADIDGETSLVKNLSGNGSVIFTSTVFNPHYSKLYINNLSGNLNFKLNVNFSENRNDSLFIKEGAGYHAISVIDSGIEITNPSSQENNFIPELDLITDQSGKAHFTLTDFSGEQIDTVDGGVYVYSLKQKDDEGGKIWYLAPTDKIAIPLITSSNMVLPIVGLPKQEEDVAISKDFIANSHINNFGIDKDKLILQNFVLRDDQVVHISDDGKAGVPNRSINNTIQKSGTIYVEAGGFGKNTTIEDGGLEVISEQGISESTIVYKGGQQRVEGGGTTAKVEIYGGDQLVFGEGYMDGRIMGSNAYGTTIYGQGTVLGQQRVYDDGIVFKTKIMNGGVQNLAKWFADDDNFALKKGGLAVDTEVFEGGMQRILSGGEADTVILHAHAIQEVHAGGHVKNLTIKGKANSLVFAGATLGGEITVYDSGQLHLYAGEDVHTTTAEDIYLNGEDAILYSVSSKFDDKSSQIRTLRGVGRVVFTSAESNLYYSHLYIDNLSGSIHFDLNVSFAEEKGDYLFIKNSSGNHTIGIVDFGIEIVDPSSTNLDLITDQSGRAHFTLQNFSGTKTGIVDGGTYAYGLRQRKDENTEGKIWYLTPVFIDNLPRRSRSLKNLSQNFSNSSNSIPFTALSLRDGTVELSDLRGGHRRSGRRRPPVLPSVSPSQEGAVETLSSGDNHQPSSEQHHPPVLLAVSPSQEGAVETLSSGDNHQPSSEQHHPPVLLAVSPSQEGAVEMSSLGDNRQPPSETQQPVISLAAPPLVYQTIEDPNHQSQDPPELKQELLASHFLTTPSTDAVLSMAVTPELIFNSELQSIRIGKGILDRNKKSATFWTYAIKNKEHLSTGHTDFKLDQTGVVLGINGLSELVNGEFYIGGFGSYNQARIAHARGGTSDINSYSIGTYATYFDHSGWYVDSVLKYNHYQNNLKAVSTNGISIQGDYKQWAVGTSFEVGYRFNISQSGWMQPYGQLTWLQVQDKEIKLSNGMTGDISPSTSLRSEIGLSLGYEFGSDMDTPSVAYIAAAWLRENIEHNHTTINKQHKFTTDLSGNSGKFGVGLSSFVSDRLKFYAEAYYLKGHKTKQLLQGILGVRYSF